MDQLDIFANSRDVALLNDALIALQRYDDAGTRRVMQVLAAEFPCDHHLPVLELLVNAIGDDAGTAPICSYVAAMETATLLTVHVRAAAIQLLGHRDAKAWLPVLWRRLAHRCAMLAYSPGMPIATPQHSCWRLATGTPQGGKSARPHRGDASRLPLHG